VRLPANRAEIFDWSRQPHVDHERCEKKISHCVDHHLSPWRDSGGGGKPEPKLLNFAQSLINAVLVNMDFKFPSTRTNQALERGRPLRGTKYAIPRAMITQFSASSVWIILLGVT
jgi:hypothetical protein